MRGFLCWRKKITIKAKEYEGIPPSAWQSMWQSCNRIYHYFCDVTSAFQFKIYIKGQILNKCEIRTRVKQKILYLRNCSRHATYRQIANYSNSHSALSYTILLCDSLFSFITFCDCRTHLCSYLELQSTISFFLLCSISYMEMGIPCIWSDTDLFYGKSSEM